MVEALTGGGYTTEGSHGEAPRKTGFLYYFYVAIRKFQKACVAHIIFFLDSVALIKPILRKRSLAQGQVMALMTTLQSTKTFGDHLTIEAK